MTNLIHLGFALLHEDHCRLMSRGRNNTDPSVPSGNRWQCYSICLSAEHTRVPCGDFLMCVYVWARVCTIACTLAVQNVNVREHLTGVGFSLPRCGFQGLN